MSFLHEAYPLPPRGDQLAESAAPSGAAISAPPGSEDCTHVPHALEQALRTTVQGNITLRRLKFACLEKYLQHGQPPLSIQLFDQPLTDVHTGQPVTDHARVDYVDHDAPDDGVYMHITTFDHGGRMQNWTDTERYLIIASHEVWHLDYIRVNQRRGLLHTDGCFGVYRACHFKHFDAEFRARIEYSLLYGTPLATPKSSWLDRYALLFEIMQRLWHPNKDEKTRVRNIKRAVRKSANKTYHDHPDFQAFRDDIIAAGDTTRGMDRCREIYEETIDDLVWYQERLDKWLDEAPRERAREIIRDKRQYYRDDHFKLVP